MVPERYYTVLFMVFFFVFSGESCRPTVWRGHYEGCADRALRESFSSGMRRGKKLGEEKHGDREGRKPDNASQSCVS